VESRAQQQMLPRLQPTCFEDIVVEVAIVRPGPIQGGAVHPYLRRRAGQEPVGYPHPSLAPVLAETSGVLLFQEQAIRISMVVAGFPPGAADMLRRALSRNRAATFVQLAGFAGYGFCNPYFCNKFFPPSPSRPALSADYQGECFFTPKYQF
jgi:DNA polymerase III alpha subunit